jgi:hypothetical protein
MRHRILLHETEFLQRSESPLSESLGPIAINTRVLFSVGFGALERPVGGSKGEVREEWLFTLGIGTLIEVTEEVLGVIVRRVEAFIVLIGRVRSTARDVLVRA